MCVIAGYIGNQPAAPVLMEMIRRQEGFGGAFFTGIATVHAGRLYYEKVVGDARTLIETTRALSLPGTIGIAHGRPNGVGNREWAHPFVDPAGTVAYIANGSRGQYEGLTDLTPHARRFFEKGVPLRSVLDSGGKPALTTLADGRMVHGSEVMALLVAELVQEHRNAPHPIFSALVESFEQWPAEIVSLSLHAQEPDVIAAARHNMPMTLGRDDGGNIYIASMGLAFPPSVNWRMRMAPRAGALIHRDGTLQLQLLRRPGVPVGELPSMHAVERRLIPLLRSREEGCKADELMNEVRSLWPAGVLNQKEIVVYEAMEALRNEGRVVFDELLAPGAVGTAGSGAVVQLRIRWRYEQEEQPLESGEEAKRTFARVRSFRSGDEAAVKAITRDAFGPMTMARTMELFFGGPVGDHSWHEYKNRSITQALQEHPEWFVVAELNGEVVGFASYSLDTELGLATVGNNAVYRRCQGQGIGSHLQREVIRQIRAAGYERWHVVTPAHDHPAQRVYEKMGFREVGRTVSYLRRPESGPVPSEEESSGSDPLRLLLVILGQVHPELQPVHGDYEQLYLKGLREAAPDLRHEVLPLVRDAAAPVPDLAAFDGILLSGGAADVTDGDSWLKPAVDLVRQAIERSIPLLGICLGHQVLAHATGGRVDFLPGGWHFGTDILSLKEVAMTDPLLSGWPEHVAVQLTHRQSVQALGPKAVVLATAAHDPFHAIRVGRCAWGLQFHPEFSDAFLRQVLALRRDRIDASAGAGASDRAAALLGPAPRAPEVLTRFARVCQASRAQASRRRCVRESERAR